ncbi:hypothetical protein BDV59DRAFT_179501 [Aspergillus ambiguus]|uniref:uncharacterized protein n=1 Tax=Aspergillus ambiguus TaxID=176160 RepID=UPI003CCD2009
MTGPNPPRRILLVSSPRTASNLLLRILNLKDQARVLTNEGGGYFFFPAFGTCTKEGRLAKTRDQWTAEDRQDVQSAYQSCVNQLEDWTARAAQDDKIFFAKEHAFWIFDPTSIHKLGATAYSATANANGQAATNGSSPHEPLFRLQFPASYGACNSWSGANETTFPDEYLRTWRLAFVIRHPALMCPSFYRAMKKMVALGVLKEHEVPGVLATNMSLQWPRMLYDWSVEQGIAGAEPLILDAHDIINNPQSVVKFSEQLGLDPSQLIFEWKANTPKNENGSPQNGAQENGTQRSEAPKDNASSSLDNLQHNKEAQKIMLGSLTASSGLLKEKAPENVDIAAEVSKWNEEFGEEAARFVEKAVLAAMPDYEYLKERRLRA